MYFPYCPRNTKRKPYDQVLRELQNLRVALFKTPLDYLNTFERYVDKLDGYESPLTLKEKCDIVCLAMARLSPKRVATLKDMAMCGVITFEELMQCLRNACQDGTRI